MKTIHEKQLFVPGKDSRKRRRQVDHRSFSRADAFKSLALENVRLDRVQDALENRSNSNGLDKSTEGRNNIPPLFSRGNANSTNTILHHRSKRAVDQAKVKKCKELERSSIQAEGTANTASGVSGIFGILNTFTFGALSAVSSGISAASSVAKAVIDVELLDMDCDDIPFEELKDILDERFNKVDKALDRNHGAIRENLKANPPSRR